MMPTRLMFVSHSYPDVGLATLFVPALRAYRDRRKGKHWDQSPRSSRSPKQKGNTPAPERARKQRVVSSGRIGVPQARKNVSALGNRTALR